MSVLNGLLSWQSLCYLHSGCNFWSYWKVKLGSWVPHDVGVLSNYLLLFFFKGTQGIEVPGLLRVSHELEYNANFWHKLFHPAGRLKPSPCRIRSVNETRGCNSFGGYKCRGRSLAAIVATAFTISTNNTLISTPFEPSDHNAPCPVVCDWHTRKHGLRFE